MTAPARPARSTRASRSLEPTPAPPLLYATDFHNARVDVFDGAWQHGDAARRVRRPEPRPRATRRSGSRRSASRVFVTYAKQDADAEDEVAGQGRGFVDAYDLHGQLPRPRRRARAAQRAVGARARRRPSFGRFGGDLLVGNFGDGEINAYAEDADGSFEHRGTLSDADGKKLEIDGLWALEFGNAGANGTPDQLFFTAGPERRDARALRDDHRALIRSSPAPRAGLRARTGRPPARRQLLASSRRSASRSGTFSFLSSAATWLRTVARETNSFDAICARRQALAQRGRGPPTRGSSGRSRSP